MDKHAQILEKAEGYRDYTAGNLSRMVRIPSLSGEEGEVIESIAAMCREAGFDEVYKYAVLYRHDPWSYGYRNSYLLLSHRPRPFQWKGRCLNVAVECWDYRPIPLPTPQGWLNVHGHIHKSGIVSVGGL